MGVQVADSCRAFAGWDGELSRSLYGSAGWLEFSASRCRGESRFGVLFGSGQVQAQVAACWSPGPRGRRYTPLRADAAVLGGCAGNRSHYSARDGIDPSGFASLVDGCLASFGRPVSHWWWPFLPSDDAKKAASALGVAVDGVGLVALDCHVDVREGGIDEHVDCLRSGQRRTNARRELRWFAESGWKIERASLMDVVGDVAPLLAQTNRRYGQAVDAVAMAGALNGQVRLVDYPSVVFVCRNGDETVVGFSLAYVSGDEITVRLAGFDYESSDIAGLYPHLAIYEPLRYAAEHGLGRVHLGLGSYEAKIRRGATVSPLWSISSFPTPTLDARTRVHEMVMELPGSDREATIEKTLSEMGEILDERINPPE